MYGSFGTAIYSYTGNRNMDCVNERAFQIVILLEILKHFSRDAVNTGLNGILG